MTVMQKLIVAFWVFVVVMLLWSFHNYNQGLTQAAVDHPQQEHFYFIHSKGSDAAPVAPKNGADVIQTSFVVQDNTPSVGSFTCLVTLKNVGNVRATAVQVSIRPYRGISTLDVDVGGQHGGDLPENDPLSLFSDWVTFPDLEPGQSITQSDVFVSRPGIEAGLNPNPQIIFQNAKPGVTTPSTPAPAPEAPSSPAPQRHPAE